MNRLSSVVPAQPKHSLWMLLCALTAAIGCSSVTTQSRTPSETLPIDAVVVNPIDLRIADMQAWDRYEKTRDIIAVLETHKGLDVIAPWEFDRIRAAEQPADYLKQTNLVPRTAKQGIAAERLVVLESVVEDESADRAAEVAFKGQRRRHRSYNSRIHVRVRLVHPSSNRVLLERTQTAVEDRFAQVSDFDTRPTIRRTLRAAVSALVSKAIQQGVIAPAAPALRFGTSLNLRENPSVVFDHRGKGPTLRKTLQAKEPIVREAAMFTRMRYLVPDLTSIDFRLFLSLPAGLLVTGTPPAPLRAGDVITHVDETPTQWRFQWIRALRRMKQAPLLRIDRDGKSMMVTLPGS